MRYLNTLISFVTLSLMAAPTLAAGTIGFQRVYECEAVEKSPVPRITLNYGKSIYSLGSIHAGADFLTDRLSASSSRFIDLEKRTLLNFQTSGSRGSLEVTASEENLMTNWFAVVVLANVSSNGHSEKLAARFSCRLVSHKDISINDLK